MEAILELVAEEVTTPSQTTEVASPRVEEDELDLFAYEMWQCASCPEKALDQSTSAAKEAWSHASSF